MKSMEQTFQEFDIEFNQLQTNTYFFVFEVLLSIYLLLILAVMAEKFLMPSLLNISKRYGLSKDITGILVAIGNMIPEATTTIISFMKHGVKMTEFGVASNIGTAVFVITVVPAAAILITMKKTKEYEEKSKHFLPEEAAKAAVQQEQLMFSVYRDMGFLIIAFVLYDILLYKRVIYLYEAVVLFGFILLYIFVIFQMNMLWDQKVKSDGTKKLDQPTGEEQPLMMMQEEEEGSSTVKKEIESQTATQIQEPEKNKLDQHKSEQHEESKVMHYLELACCPVIYPVSFILPVNKLPELAFLIIVVLFFFATDFILTVVGVFSIYTHMSHILLGLTIIAWGSSPIEFINLIVAAGKNEVQIGITSILSGIVMAFYILMPVAMIFKMVKRGTREMEVLSPVHSSAMLCLPALAITIFTLIVFHKTQMKIGKIGAALLIAAYIVYIALMGYLCSGDTD